MPAVIFMTVVEVRAHVTELPSASEQVVGEASVQERSVGTVIVK